MDIRETPWLTPESVAFLEELVNSNLELKVLEFGCGGSTMWLARKLQFPQARLVTVEHDPEWYKAIRSRVGAGVEMHLKQRPYGGICSDFPDDYFDLVLIDGRNRVLCAAYAMRIVKPGGFIMLDNAERREYTPIGSVLLKEWQCRRTAQYNCPEAAADGVWATDIWRKPFSKNVANVADDVLVAHGETAALRGDFESAEALARLSLEKNEHVADALNLLAIATCSKEQVNDAHRLLEAGYALEPTNANVSKNLAMICAKLGLREEAQGIYDNLLATSDASGIANPGRSVATSDASGIANPGRSGTANPGRSEMKQSRRRARVARDVRDPRSAVETARELFRSGRQLEAFDLYEQIAEAHPGHSVEIMADAYDCYAAMPDQNDRYNLYQARLFDFDIKPTDKVLDVGSGHAPFPLATHLADLDLGEGWTGRAGMPFKHIDGKPVYQCNIESLPFADKEFDFVYCSHALEHVANPEAACGELMRVAKRGYIETPTRGKDLWFDTARVSNHKWAIELFNDTLIFTEYSERDIDGLHCDVISKMHMHPESSREKAITSLQYLKADRFNTMLMWDGSFKYEVRRLEDRSAAPSAPAPVPDPSQARQPDSVFTAGQDATEDWLRQTALRINQAGGDPEKLTTIAGELAEHGHDDTAEELARMVISQTPSFADAHNVLGVIYYSRGKNQDALRYFETANRLAPGNTDIGQNLVMVYTQVDQFEKAVEVCQKMLASNPTDTKLPEIIGNLLQTISDTALATLDTLNAAESSATQPTPPPAIEKQAEVPHKAKKQVCKNTRRIGKPAKKAASQTTSGKPGSKRYTAREVRFVNTCYPEFLNSHYSRDPKLLEASYEEQKRSIEETFFGDADFYSNGMKLAGWDADDLIINCNPLQMAWTKENGFAGAGPPVAVEQIAHKRPDVVYLQNLALASPEFLSAIRPYTKLIAGQIASPVPEGIDVRGLDIIFSSFPHFVERFRRMGVTAYYQPLAFDPRVLEHSSNGGKRHGATFIGGISRSHGKGTELLEQVAAAAPIEVWGYGAETLDAGSPLRKSHRGEAWGLDMFSLLRQSAITINRHIDVAENNANNMRLFEATGCGAMLVTDYKDNLNELFEIGKEVVAYRSSEECAALVKYYLAHPEEAETIARAGQQRTLRDHTYEMRMKQTAEILGRHLRYIDEPARLGAPDMARISWGHTTIDKSEITEGMVTAWQNEDIPARQRALVHQELANMYSGRVEGVFQLLADCLKPYVAPGTSVLEIGCASGYYYEVLEYLLNKRIAYTGVDYSEPLIRMAKDYYPSAEFVVADGANLPFEDGRFDVAISSGVLLHVPNYKEHIAQTARVARKIVVAHRTPVCRARPTQYMKKFAYGVETIEIMFNENELLSEIQSHGLQLVSAVENFSIPRNDEYGVTYVFTKRS